MTIEEKVLKRKRFIPEAMEPFGFRKTDAEFVYTTDFMDGDFSATVTVTERGEVRGTVFDNMNGEVYAPLRAESYNGAYVNEVRAAYEAVLSDIAEHCCKDVLFTSDQANRIADRIERLYGVRPDFPWGQSPYDSAGTFRHTDSGKWFALIMNIRRGLLSKDADSRMIDVMNLKIDPNEKSPLQDGVYPAYHMNHKMWITVTLDDTLSDDAVMKLVDVSFRMTAGGTK